MNITCEDTDNYIRNFYSFYEFNFECNETDSVIILLPSHPILVQNINFNNMKIKNSHLEIFT